ncbi:MAG TPA: sigma-70 family RNA polymerase sigma factor [Trebonia sp.]|nr:sigma-70 family RNA polymerase sigma factor [Trebonia sp.]
MDDDWLVWRYEASRARLRSMAYRMLGSMNDADDAVQEAWIHVAGGDATGVANLDGWFTTIVARVCLDMLRYRKSRREAPADVSAAAFVGAPLDGAGGGVAAGPEQEVMLADSVGIALLVVLDKLAPAERVAFVLHEMFGLPFAEIAAITGRSPAAARQLASRARRRIHGAAGTYGAAGADGAAGPTVLARQRALAEAFLAASRGADLGGLLAVLDPDVVLRGDSAALPSGVAITIRGARRVARAARSAAARSRYYSGIALVNGMPGIVYAPRGRLTVVLVFSYSEERISGIDVIAEQARLDALGLALP